MRFSKQKQNDQRSYDSQDAQERPDQHEESSGVGEVMSPQELVDSLDQLNGEFQELEKLRESIRSRVVSIANLLPQFNEQKDRLQKDVEEKRKEAEQLNLRITMLSQQEEASLRRISDNQEEKTRLEQQLHLDHDKVKEIKKVRTELTGERQKGENIVQQKLHEIKKLDEQITQIKRMQTYGFELVNTLRCTSK